MFTGSGTETWEGTLPSSIKVGDKKILQAALESTTVETIKLGNNITIDDATTKWADGDKEHVGNTQIVRATNLTLDLNGFTLDLGVNKLIFGSGIRTTTGGSYTVSSSVENGILTGTGLYTLGYSEVSGFDFVAEIGTNVSVQNKNTSSKITAPVMFTFNKVPAHKVTLNLSGNVVKNTENQTTNAENAQFIYDEWGDGALSAVTASTGTITVGSTETVVITGKTITMSKMTNGDGSTLNAYASDSSNTYGDFTFNIN